MFFQGLLSFCLFVAQLVRGLDLPLDCSDGIMTTPTYGTTGAVFTACSNNTIHRPPSLIYEVLIDFPKYGEWNTFVYAVDLPANVTSARDVYVGMPMTFHTSDLVPEVNTTSDEMITYLEPHDHPPFAGWRYNPGPVVDLVMEAEHISALYDIGDGRTRYVSWETYYGAGALVVETLKANLVAEFEKQGSDLKKRVENLR